MIAIGRDSPIHRASLLTVPACAAAIRADVRSGRSSTADTLRFVRETINNWTSGRCVTPFWFCRSTPSLHAYAYAHSPAALANRGVFIDPADLESV